MNQRVSNAALNRCHAFSACPAVIPLPAVIGTLLLVIAGCASPPGQPVLTGEESVAVPPDAQLSDDPLSKHNARITIAGVGDIMLGTDFPENHLPDDDGVSFLSDVTPVLRAADIAFGNLEGVLADGGEPEKECEDPSACYLFRSPTRYAVHLAQAGFAVVSLANNHAMDFGEAGRTSTMQALDAVGIRHSGRQGDVAMWPAHGLNYCVIAFSPTRGSHSLLDLEPAIALVAGLAADHDILIVSIHGGAEGVDGVERIPFGMEFAYGEKRGDVARFARAMVEAGADLVIGHGPHLPRAMELYRDRLIAYSLGNFATYYGISVTGPKGYAPILLATLDGIGRFRSGKIVSAIQVRPGGPLIDPEQKAYSMIVQLTELDFDGGGLAFTNDGRFWPADPRMWSLEDELMANP